MSGTRELEEDLGSETQEDSEELVSNHSSNSDSSHSVTFTSSGGSVVGSGNSSWAPSDELESFDDDDDYFLNELDLPDSQDMDTEDGGYDDDTDVDDEVVILEPGDENAQAVGDDSDSESNDDQETDDEENDRAGLPPPRKVARIDPNPDVLPAGVSDSGNTVRPPQVEEDKDSDGFTCSICYDQFTNSGEHRISSLKCGHVFGKNCIEKWLKIHGRCPQCNCKAKKAEVRVLYVKSLQAIDNTDLTDAKKELEKSQITIAKYTLETAKQKITIDSLNQQIQHLECKLKQNSMNYGAVPVMPCNNPGPSSSNKIMRSSSLSYVQVPASSNSLSQIVPQVSSTSHQSTGRKQLRYSFAKWCEIKEGTCRVGAYNDWMNLMVVSHDMKNSLFPNGCCGIKQFNMLEFRPTLSMPLHQKQIRDMQFSLCQNDVMLTVSLDKKATLYNCGGNVAIQSFQTEYPLWSCVWDEVQQHIFYVGCSNGQIIAYDIRSPQDPLATYPQDLDRSPVCRLRYVSPSSQSNAFNLQGLLVQKLNSVSFGECRGGSNSEIRFHQLPVEGPFFNVDFENASRHLLISTRPSPRNDVDHGSHLLCDLGQYYSETLERNVVTSNVVHMYQGNNRDGQKISRPSLFSPEDGYVFVLANGSQNAVKYWDISLSSTNNQTINNAPDYILDYVHGSVNSNHFLGMISEKGVRIYNRSLD